MANTASHEDLQIESAYEDYQLDWALFPDKLDKVRFCILDLLWSQHYSWYLQIGLFILHFWLFHVFIDKFYFMGCDPHNHNFTSVLTLHLRTIVNWFHFVSFYIQACTLLGKSMKQCKTTVLLGILSLISFSLGHANLKVACMWVEPVIIWTCIILTTGE